MRITYAPGAFFINVMDIFVSCELFSCHTIIAVMLRSQIKFNRLSKVHQLLREAENEKE